MKKSKTSFIDFKRVLILLSLLDKELYLIATEDLDTISVELNNFKEN